jgi:hypothetical protein
MFLKQEQDVVLQSCASRNISEYLSPKALSLFRGVAKPGKDWPCGSHIRQ